MAVLKSFFYRELQAAREQLLELGQDVSSIDASLKLTTSNPAENRNNVTTQLVSDLTSEQTSGSNPGHIDTRNRSRLAQASAKDLDEIKNSLDAVKDPRYALKQDDAIGSSDISVGKRRRIGSRNDDVVQQVPAYQYHQSPMIRSRDAMPPPSLPARVPRTPKKASNAQNGRAINIPIPLPPVNISRTSIFNPTTSNLFSPSYSHIRPGKVGPFDPTQNHRGSLSTTGRQHHFSPQVSADQMITAQMLPQGFGQQLDFTPIHHDQNGVHSFPQGGQGHPLLNETMSPLNRTRFGSHINPCGQNLVGSREVDGTCAEIKSSPDTISGADPSVRHADSNGSFPKGHGNTHPYHRNGDHPEISRIGNVNGAFLDAIGSERRLRLRKNRTGINDGELDQNTTHASSLINSTFTATPTRVSLPPRGPSSVGTPRLRTGMSANARSSSNIFIPPMPTAFRPHREPLDNMAMGNPYVASPYFSYQSLPLPPQSSPPFVDPSKSLVQARTFVEAPFRIDQRSQAGSNRPAHESLGGRSGFLAGSPADGAGREDRSSAAGIRRARR